MNIPLQRVDQETFDQIPTLSFEGAKTTKLSEYKYISNTGKQWLYHREGCVYVLEVGEKIEGKQPLQAVSLADFNFPKHWDRKTKRAYIRAYERCQKKGYAVGSVEYHQELRRAGFNKK